MGGGTHLLTLSFQEGSAFHELGVGGAASLPAGSHLRYGVQNGGGGPVLQPFLPAALVLALASDLHIKYARLPNQQLQFIAAISWPTFRLDLHMM